MEFQQQYLVKLEKKLMKPLELTVIVPAPDVDPMLIFVVELEAPPVPMLIVFVVDAAVAPVPRL